LILGLFFSVPAVSQDEAEDEIPPEAEPAVFNTGSVPAALRVPQRGESPRYPRDLLIGELGRGSAPEGAYDLARRVLGDLVLERESDVFDSLGGDLLKTIRADLKVIDPRKYRIGGGREEPDGSVSFLFRFLGRDQWISGELYLRRGSLLDAAEDNPGGRWTLDDLILDEARETSAGKEAYRFDFTPYERFY
jgi:hypothetical protein